MNPVTNLSPTLQNQQNQQNQQSDQPNGSNKGAVINGLTLRELRPFEACQSISSIALRIGHV